MQHYLYKLKRVGKLGATSLIEHKLRSFLTALGIIFGVSSVIAMLAIGEGASYEAREQIRSMGSTNIIIRSRKPEESSSTTGSQSRLSIYGLTYQDVIRIRTLYPGVQIHVPAREITARLRHRDVRLPGKVIGTVPWFLEKSPLDVRFGRFIDQYDVETVSNAVVLTEATAHALFPLEFPLGNNIYLGDKAFHVVGIVANTSKKTKKEEKSGRDVYEVYVSISAAKDRFGETIVKQETGSFSMERVELHELTITAPSDEAVVSLANSVRTTLQHYHKDNDFEITVPLELLRQAEQTKRIFNIVLGSIAAISLLVGGIGIMNIMLASVTERTREIGIRRALGATRADIILQFLTEALLLSLAGGTIGVALGISVPAIVSHFAGLMTIVKMDSLVLAFTISVLIGMIFGIYPAFRAAALSPIEALRHE